MLANEGQWTSAGIRVLRLCDAQPERNRWLWDRRIPLGMLTVLEGDPKTGKSTITADLAARVTTGRPMPEDFMASSPANVIFISTEDHPALTLRPRFEAAGADLARVFLVTQMRDNDGSGVSPTLTPAGIARLEQQVSETNARLVVIDPLMNYLPADVDAHRDQDIRRVLRELVAMAQRSGTAVVVVRHLTKAFGGSALYRGAGSIGIAGAARSILTAHRDSKGHRLVVTASNVANAVPTLYYDLVPQADAATVGWSTVPRARDATPKRVARDTEMVERELIALTYARDHGRVSSELLSDAISMSSATAGRVLGRLRKVGELGADGALTPAGNERLSAAGR